MTIRARSQQLAGSIWSRTKTSVGHVSTGSVNTVKLFWNWKGNIWTQSQAIARDAGRWSKHVAKTVWDWIIKIWTKSKGIATAVWRWIQRLVETITFSLSASFLAAVAFAMGHHFFYQSLVNTVPPSADTGISGFLQNASGQSYNIAIGTLFATITAALLGASIKTAHEQLSWKAAKAKPTDLETLDHLFLREIWPLSLWYRYFGPEMLALLLRFLPFLPIIAPAQLNIQFVLVKNSTMMALPTVAFDNGNFAEQTAYGRDDDSAGLYQYGGSLSPVRKAVTQSLVAGSVVDIPAPFPNSTYSTEFYGPALRCNEISKGSSLWTNQSITVQNASVGGSQEYYYISWPGVSLYPWNITTGATSFDPPNGLQGSPVSLTVIGNANATEYYGTENMTLIQCQVWNASYAANFSYENGVQNVSSTISSYVHTMDAILSVSAIALDYSYIRNWSYLAVMDVFQDYVTGSISFPFSDNLGGSPTITTSMIMTSLVSSDELLPLSTPIKGLGSYRSGISMKDTLETMFHNATISLASQTLLLQSVLILYYNPVSEINSTLIGHQ
ncbi:hypothetical protein Hte_007983 [Hypoxylon texense]